MTDQPEIIDADVPEPRILGDDRAKSVADLAESRPAEDGADTEGDDGAATEDEAGG